VVSPAPTRIISKINAIEMLNQRFTVDANTQISKGVLCKLTDPVTAVAIGIGEGDVVVAGIASMDKSIANSDTSTQLTFWTRGRFKGSASGAITVGDYIIADGGGSFSAWVMTPKTAVAMEASFALVCGRSLETAADTDDFEFEFNALNI